MPAFYPHSKIFHGKRLTATVSGPHIQVLNSISGERLASTADLDDVSALLKSGPIICCSMDQSEQYLATCGSDKVLKIWQLDGLKLLNQRELPKRPTMLYFTRDAQRIVSSDKFGDVFSYPFHPSPEHSKGGPEKEEEEEKPKIILFGQDNSAGGQLILGHTSLLTCFALTSDEKYIITADRDEHIRVSQFPHGYNIEMYCLGHQHFVSAIHIPSAHPQDLISGGGDPSLKIWDWKSGTLKHQVDVLSLAESAVAVRPSPYKTKRHNPRNPSKSQDHPNPSPEVSEDLPNDVVMDQEDDSIPDMVFAVHKIASIQNNIIFSIIGCTALFSIPYPTQTVSPAAPSKLDFGKPILDFCINGDNTIYVCLDANWGDSSNMVKMVQLVNLHNDQLSLEEGVDNPLCTTLNSGCLIPVSESDLKALDLYEGLVTLPKSLDNPVDQEGGTHEDKNSGEFKRTGKKQAARKKTRQALNVKRMKGDDL